MDEGAQRSGTEIPKEQAMRVKTHVIGAVAGIEAADKAAAALYELAGTEQLQRKDAQKTVQLAKQGLDMALTRAQALDGMRELSSDARSEATTATNKLKEARTTLQRMEKQVAAKMTRNDMEQLREHAQDLHTSLSNAENSVERIAKAYDVATDLELGG